MTWLMPFLAYLRSTERHTGRDIMEPDGQSRVAMVIRIGIDGEGDNASPFIGWGFNQRFLAMLDQDLNREGNLESKGTIAKTIAQSMRDMAAQIESGEVLKHTKSVSADSANGAVTENRKTADR
jgi:hypothetical protein